MTPNLFSPKPTTPLSHLAEIIKWPPLSHTLNIQALIFDDELRQSYVIDLAPDGCCFIFVFALTVNCFASASYVTPCGVFYFILCASQIIQGKEFYKCVWENVNWIGKTYFPPISGNYCSVDGLVCLLHSEDTSAMSLEVAPEPTEQITHLRIKAEKCLAFCDKRMVLQLRKTFLF